MTLDIAIPLLEIYAKEIGLEIKRARYTLICLLQHDPDYREPTGINPSICLRTIQHRHWMKPLYRD